MVIQPCPRCGSKDFEVEVDTHGVDDDSFFPGYTFTSRICKGCNLSEVVKRTAPDGTDVTDWMPSLPQ